MVIGGQNAWSCIGYFNELIDQIEKCGGRAITIFSDFFLRSFISKVGALDIDFCGNSYTWCNWRWGTINIREMLNRALARSNWRILFLKAMVVHLNASFLNHAPILLHLSLDHPKTQRPFRFIEAWIWDPICEQVVRDAWHSHYFSRRLSLVAKIQATTKALRYWNRNSFGYSEAKIKDIENHISYLQGCDPSVESVNKEYELQSELNVWLERSENIWRKKSRELWLKDGNCNLKFFHASTITNRRRIFIASMKDDGGQWLDSRYSIGKFMCHQFANLFKANENTIYPNLSSFIGLSVSFGENEGSVSIPSTNDITDVFKGLDLSKFLGPDGMPAAFF